MPAGAIEAAVLSEIRCIVEDDGLKREVFEQTEGIVDRQQAKLAIQLRQLEHQLSRDQAETQRSSLDGLSGQLNQARRDDLRLRMESESNQIDEVRQSIEAAKQTRLQRKDIAVAFKDFDSLWALLNPRERTQLLDLLIERVEFDRQSSALSITYHPDSDRGIDRGRRNRMTAQHERRVKKITHSRNWRDNSN